MQTIEKMSTMTKVLLAGAVIGGVYFLTRTPKKPVAGEDQPEIPPQDGLGSTGPEGEPLYEFNIARSSTPQGQFFYGVIYQSGVVPRRVLTRVRENEQGKRFSTRNQATQATRRYIQTALEASAVCVGGCRGIPLGEILPPLDLPVP